jgi:PST family polysaccharide transporter
VLLSANASLRDDAAASARSDEQKSYREILRSSAMIGGASAAGIAVGIVRTKLTALILGPAGYGLMGLYGSIADLAVNVAGMGVGSSGVRQIAEAASLGDPQRVARVAAVVRRITVLLGLVGAIVLSLLAAPIARMTFGDDTHASMVALVSFAVLFQVMQFGQSALLQGTRHIAELAKVQVLGTLLGAAASVTILYWLKSDGVALALVTGVLCSMGLSWWYSRGLIPTPPVLSWYEMRHEAPALFKLGFVFMASGFLTLAAAYAVRRIVVQHEGLAAAGLYQTAWTLGGLYVGFVLQAMGTDFYPRIVAVAHDDRQCNRLVNEQTLVGMLLAGPGLLATITFAPLMLHLFFSRDFIEADGILRWICMGMALRAVVWPMGYVLVAKNQRVLFLGVDLLWSVVAVGLCAWLVRRFHAEGAGMAFFGAYVLHGLVLYPAVRRLSGFRLSRSNACTLLLLSVLVALTCAAPQVLPPHAAMLAGAAATLAAAVHSVRTLARLDALPRMLRQPLRRLAVVLHAGALRDTATADRREGPR